MWHVWQAIRATCRLVSPSACGFSPWQSAQATRTPSLAQLFGSYPVGILWSFAPWQSTQTILFAAWTSVSFVKENPRLRRTPPPAASWQTMQFLIPGLPTAIAAFTLRSWPMTTRPFSSLYGFRRRKSYAEEWHTRQSIAFSASFPVLPTSLMWFPGWQVLQPVNFVFPVFGFGGSLSGCSRCRCRCTSCRSGSSSRTLSPVPGCRRWSPGRRVSSGRCRETSSRYPGGTPAPRR